MTGGVRLSVRELVVEYVSDGYSIRPIDGLSFEVPPGRLAVLLGPSGSGKTTLLSALGGLLTPSSGVITLGETVVTDLSPGELEEFRRGTVGFVFQAFNLIPSLSATENVAVPLLLAGVDRAEALDRANRLLVSVGLDDRRDHRPAHLSGGQQQRVAIARGLVHDPPLLLADEPTANLDHIQAESIIRLLRELRDAGRVIVISTHDARLVPIADDIVEMAHEAGSTEHPPQQVRYEAGESIFEQGTFSELVYFVDEGEVDIVRVHADGSEEPLAVLGPGRYFGELGPILGFPRSASARARSVATLTAMGVGDFRRRVGD